MKVIYIFNVFFQSLSNCRLNILEISTVTRHKWNKYNDLVNYYYLLIFMHYIISATTGCPSLFSSMLFIFGYCHYTQFTLVLQ